MTYLERLNPWCIIRPFPNMRTLIVQLEQWVAACCTLIRACRDLKALNLVWSAIEQEATRYTEEAFNRLTEIHAQRQAYLHPH